MEKCRLDLDGPDYLLYLTAHAKNTKPREFQLLIKNNKTTDRIEIENITNKPGALKGYKIS